MTKTSRAFTTYQPGIRRYDPNQDEDLEEGTLAQEESPKNHTEAGPGANKNKERKTRPNALKSKQGLNLAVPDPGTAAKTHREVESKPKARQIEENQAKNKQPKSGKNRQRSTTSTAAAQGKDAPRLGRKNRKGKKEDIEEIPPKNEQKPIRGIVRRPEDDFFYGYKEGIELLSLANTGMYGKVIFVNGARMSIEDCPDCLRESWDEIEDCEACEFQTPHNCLLRLDRNLHNDLHRILGARRHWRLAYLQKQKEQAELIHDELKVHGRPLHYQTLIKIVLGRHPKSGLNPVGIYQLILDWPLLFERVDVGVYKAR